jgi:hypothetical protein
MVVCFLSWHFPTKILWDFLVLCALHVSVLLISSKYEQKLLFSWRWLYCGMLRRNGGSLTMFKRYLLPPSLGTNRPDDGGSKHLWNVGKLLLDNTAQHPRRKSSSYSPTKFRVLFSSLAERGEIQYDRIKSLISVTKCTHLDGVKISALKKYLHVTVYKSSNGVCCVVIV